MSDRLKALREQQAKLVSDARAKLNEITEDTEEARAKEIEVEFDRMMTEHDKIGERIEREEKLAEKQAELEAVDKTKRPNGDARSDARETRPEDKEARAKAHRDAFRRFMRYGIGSLDNEQRKLMVKDVEERTAQAVGTDATGGYLVPEGFQAELIKSLKAWGPMNDDTIVRVLDTATGNVLPWPSMDDTANEGSLIAENTQVSESNLTFSTKQLDAYKYTTGVTLVSSELLQDSGLDVEAIIRDAMVERIGRILNRHFTVGTGSGQPNGIVTAATLGVTAASASAFTADEIIDLLHSVDPAYRSDPSMRWMFNDTTFKQIRKLKDGQSNYLWQPQDVRTGAPAQLLGHPYSVNQAMSDVGDSSPSGDDRAIVVGAFNRFVVRRVRAWAMRRLTERYADYDQVGFIGFTRADSELIDTAAVKYLTFPGGA